MLRKSRVFLPQGKSAKKRRDGDETLLRTPEFYLIDKPALLPLPATRQVSSHARTSMKAQGYSMWPRFDSRYAQALTCEPYFCGFNQIPYEGRRWPEAI